MINDQKLINDQMIHLEAYCRSEVFTWFLLLREGEHVVVSWHLRIMFHREMKWPKIVCGSLKRKEVGMSRACGIVTPFSYGMGNL